MILYRKAYVQAMTPFFSGSLNAIVNKFECFPGNWVDPDMIYR